MRKKAQIQLIPRMRKVSSGHLLIDTFYSVNCFRLLTTKALIWLRRLRPRWLIRSLRCPYVLQRHIFSNDPGSGQWSRAVWYGPSLWAYMPRKYGFTCGGSCHSFTLINEGFFSVTYWPPTVSISKAVIMQVSLTWKKIMRFQSLRKHAYSYILKILQPKTGKFPDKNYDVFHISAENIDCGYSLEPPRRAPTLYVFSRNKKNNVHPCKNQFYYIKVGFHGVKIIKACFHDACKTSLSPPPPPPRPPHPLPQPRKFSFLLIVPRWLWSLPGFIIYNIFIM